MNKVRFLIEVLEYFWKNKDYELEAKIESEIQ